MADRAVLSGIVRSAGRETSRVESSRVESIVRRRIEADMAASMQGALLRLIQAAHALRLEATESPLGWEAPALRALQKGIDSALAEVVVALDENSPLGQLPPLRQLFEAAQSDGAGQSTLIELDEVADAINMSRRHQYDRSPAAAWPPRTCRPRELSPSGAIGSAPNDCGLQMEGGGNDHP